MRGSVPASMRGRSAGSSEAIEASVRGNYGEDSWVMFGWGSLVVGEIRRVDLFRLGEVF